MIRFRMAVILLAALVLAGADAVHREVISFPDGASEVTLPGQIKGYDSVEYTVAAGAGQAMSLTLDSAHPMLAMNVFAPGDMPGESTALFNGARSGGGFQAALAATGDYTIQVYLIRAAARRGEAADYRLTVAVTGTAQAPAATPPEATPAAAPSPGPAGEPERWQVTADGVTLRAVPADSGSALAGVAAGSVVRNLGCRTLDGVRWCQVEQAGAKPARGWLPAAVLRAAAADTEPAEAETSGILPCAFRSAQMRASCRFEADPRGGGTATVTIERPDGQRRRISFEAGRAVTSNLGPDAALTTTRRGGVTLVGIGTERYEIPDAAIWGG